MEVTEFKMVFKNERPTLCDLHEEFIHGVKKVKVHNGFIKIKLEWPMTFEEAERLFFILSMQLDVPVKLKMG